MGLYSALRFGKNATVPLIYRIVQRTQGAIADCGTWWPQITFRRASPCLVGYLMGDKECLKNRGDVKEPGVPFRWHYLKWDLLQVDKNRGQKTSQKKGR